MMTVTISGEQWRDKCEGDLPLLWCPRDDLGLSGSEYGCGECCRGLPLRSALDLAAS